MARRSFVPIVAGLGVVTVMQIVGAQAPELASLYTYSRNLQPIGESPRRAPVTESGSAVYNSDLAFAGQSVYQGTYEGFRIIDVSSPATPRVIVNFADCVQGTT